MTNFPKFILGDNTDFPDDLYVVHTEFPRFIFNINTDEIEWLEEFDPEQDEKEFEQEAQDLLQQAYDFYEREVSRYDE